MTPDQAGAYVGKPYEDDGEGPNGYNCWGLLRHIQRVYFGKELPAISLRDPEQFLHFHMEGAGRYYEAIDQPEHGCAVLLRGGDSPHVGTWLDIEGGGILHAMAEFGVVWSPKAILNYLGYGRIKYYRVK